jgi:hypothetical protein
MRDKNFALLVRQFFKGGLKLVEKHAPGVSCFRACIRRGKQFLNREHLAIVGAPLKSCKSSGRFFRKLSMMRLRATRNSHAPACSIGFISR